jgi:hypothetical protein
VARRARGWRNQAKNHGDEPHGLRTGAPVGARQVHTAISPSAATKDACTRGRRIEHVY